MTSGSSFKKRALTVLGGTATAVLVLTGCAGGGNGDEPTNDAITVGTTEFTVQFLGSIWPGLRTEFERRGIQLKIEHVRTRHLWARLDAKQVDLVCGSLAAEHDQPVALD